MANAALLRSAGLADRTVTLPMVSSSTSIIEATAVEPTRNG
ncbi:hypothetical protein [Streptomyces canus]|nr:hypothetical protein [Streptomyces canus]